MFLAKKGYMPPVHVNNLGTLVEKFNCSSAQMFKEGQQGRKEKDYKITKKRLHTCISGVDTQTYLRVSSKYIKMIKCICKKTPKFEILLLIMVGSILLIRKFSRGFILRSFMKIKSSPNAETTLSFTVIGKSSLVANF